VHGDSPAAREGGLVHDDRRTGHAFQRAPGRFAGRVSPGASGSEAVLAGGNVGLRSGNP
jgi:hypothetical protein